MRGAVAPACTVGGGTWLPVSRADGDTRLLGFHGMAGARRVFGALALHLRKQASASKSERKMERRKLVFLTKKARFLN